MAFLIGGCSSASPPSGSPASDQVGGAGQKTIADFDAEVLAVVLATLPHESEKIKFLQSAAAYPQTVEDVLYRHEAEPWAKLSPAQLESFKVAAEHLVTRIRAPVLFHKFIHTDERIQIIAPAEMNEETGNPFSGRPVQAWPPGYSPDRKFAVVRLIIPWSMHTSEGTYLLELKDGKWTVCLRQIVYYV